MPTEIAVASDGDSGVKEETFASGVAFCEEKRTLLYDDASSECEGLDWL
jgi:hypothetical protein